MVITVVDPMKHHITKNADKVSDISDAGGTSVKARGVILFIWFKRSDKTGLDNYFPAMGASVRGTQALIAAQDNENNRLRCRFWWRWVTLFSSVGAQRKSRKQRCCQGPVGLFQVQMAVVTSICRTCNVCNTHENVPPSDILTNGRCVRDFIKSS